LYRFALSQEITTAVIGCDTIAEVEENARLARRFVPLEPHERELLVTALEPYARRLMYYKE